MRTIVAPAARGSRRSGRSSPAGGLRRSRSVDAVLARERRQLGVVGDELVQAVLDVEPVRDRSRGAARARPAGSGRPAVATPTSAVVGSSGSASATRADDREAVLGLPRPRRVEHRDDVVAAGSADAARGLAVVRVAGEALGEDQEPPLRATPRPGSSEGSWTPSTNCDARPGVVARAAGCRRGRRGRRGCAICAPAAMPRPDSTMQPSITPSPSARAACAIRTASRIPPDFASLMLIPCARSAQRATSASVWQSSST